jgi:hypothetical protein
MDEAPRVTSRHSGIWAVMSFGQTTAKAVREIQQMIRLVAFQCKVIEQSKSMNRVKTAAPD